MWKKAQAETPADDKRESHANKNSLGGRNWVVKNVCKYLSTTAAAELKEKQAKAFLAALEAKRAAVVEEGYVMDGDMGSWELMGPEKLQV